MGEGLGPLYNFTHTHIPTHVIFVHSKFYLAKYLEMCHTDIVYRLWCNTFQLSSPKGITFVHLKFGNVTASPESTDDWKK